ncbi:MAG: helix-turn-helix domain-containing protein [Lachnospiraceae bacterium]|nr:helix-turn-helix domain-containing protein [Lachnospiraceae bacterium]
MNIDIESNNIQKKVQRLLGYNIHMLRMMRGYSQKSVADKLEKSPNAVSNWELGNTSPSVDDLLKLCDMFEVTPNQILGTDECPELQAYIDQTENLVSKVEELKKQKREIEKQLKTYSQKINRKK